MHFDKTTF